MKYFLEELASYVNKYKIDEFDQLDIVFPNRRAGVFFRKNLARIIDRPVWSPRILSVEDFLKGLSGYQSADHLTLIIILYRIYQQYIPNNETFDQFYYWGEMLLSDFDDIDKNLGDAKAIFSNLHARKEIESQFMFIDEEQRKVIEQFWGTFGAKLSGEQQYFLKIWEKLPEIYQAFVDQLQKNRLAYDGMIFKEVANEIEEISYERQVIFAGFNALTKAERQIIKHLSREGKAQVFWDIDAYYLNNSNHEAGHFFRIYKNDAVLSKNFPEKIPSNISDNQSRNINLYGTSSEIAQIKKIAEIIAKMAEDDQWDPKKTAIVLTNENLLFPVLSTLPKNVSKINITMGYPLKNTAVYDFLNLLIQLQLNIKISGDGKYYFNHRDVINILKHPYFSPRDKNWVQEKIADIRQRNLINIEPDFLMIPGGGYPGIFKKISDINELFIYFEEILGYLDNQKEAHNELEKEIFYHFHIQLNRLKEIIQEQQLNVDIKTFARLFRQVIQFTRIPFTGEPLEGLQVMGVLETRNLDFDHIFIISLNEGNFPSSPGSHSFIPFNLRKGFGLTTFEQQDAIYAYYFYRLLQKSKTVNLFYTTIQKEGNESEMSRFIYQLIYESGFKINKTYINNPVRQKLTNAIVIEKDEVVMGQLNQYLADHNSFKRFTPSAVNTYLDCQLKFYFRYVAQLYESDEIQEEVDAMVFGNILHHSLEHLFSGFLQKYKRDKIDKEDIEWLKNNIDSSLQFAFRQHYGITKNEYTITGRNIIVYQILKKYIEKILEKDRDYAPFRIVGLETKSEDGYNYDLPVQLKDGEKKIGLKGVIDRIDLKDGVVRIIDYKSGKDDKRFAGVPSLFDRENKYRNKAAFQTLYYSLLIKERISKPICPGIFNSRELFSPDFSIHLQIKDEVTNKFIPVYDIRGYLNEYERYLKDIFKEIYDLNTSFKQTEDTQKCTICPYRGICHRNS